PGRAHGGIVRQHEEERPDDVRRDAQQHLALLQRLAHQVELVLLEVAQPAVDQLRAASAGGPREVALFDEQDREAAAGRIARDARAVDPPAHDQEVEPGRLRGRHKRRNSTAARPRRGGKPGEGRPGALVYTAYKLSP